MHQDLGPGNKDNKKIKGTYCLVLWCDEDFDAQIGKIGVRRFHKGGYIYAGSALGGLKGRIARHLREKKKIFWHIDYLLARKQISTDNIFYRESLQNMECSIAGLLAIELKGCPGFGSTDCGCQSHLFRFKAREKEGIFKLLKLAGYKNSSKEDWL